MLCPDILARTLTEPSTGNGSKPYAYGNSWQYHSRSDRHSKVMCWGVTLDLMLACPLLREHVSTGKVSVGINHEMSDFRNKKKKNLDLVLCRSTESGTFGGSKSGRQAARTFAELAPIYGIALTDHERSLLDTLPPLKIGKVGVSSRNGKNRTLRRAMRLRASALTREIPRTSETRAKVQRRTQS